jgi:peptidoglycan/LPS O-acetylase OafA/YrhL
MSSAPRTRVLELDALRGLAALAVALFHYSTHYANEIGHLTPPAFGFPPGNYAVQLFFMISGYVIFMTLERTRTAMDFVVSRFSRLFPAYWMAIILTASIAYAIGGPDKSPEPSWSQILVNFTMVQEILGFEHLDGSYWTLQIELFFYCQMLFWFITGQLQRVQWIIVLWLAIALVFGVAERYFQHTLSYALRELLIARHIPFFAIGVLFYRLTSGAGRVSTNWALIAASIGVVALVNRPVYTWVVLTCTAIFWLFRSNRLGFLRARPFVFLGTISYSLYLLHQTIGFDVLWHVERHGASGTVAVLVATVIMLALASALTFAVERPAMKWIRARWKGRRGRGAQVAADQPLSGSD